MKGDNLMNMIGFMFVIIGIATKNIAFIPIGIIYMIIFKKNKKQR